MTEIIQKILNNVSNDFDKSTGLFLYDTTKAVAIVMDDIYKEIDSIKEKQWIENLSDEELTKKVYERTGIERHNATFSRFTVTITGLGGTVVKQGDKVSNDSNFFSFVKDFTIPANGVINVEVVSDVSGIAGNTAANTVTSFPVTIEGVHSVTNPEPVTNGFPQENDEDLLKRYYEYLQLPSTSGNKAHYKSWAKEVVGVGDAKVFPVWNGGGTVKVTIINANKKAADEQLIENVYNHIEEVRPIGATVTVVSATENKLNVSVKLTISTGYSLNNINNIFKEELEKYFASISFTDSYVSIARIGNILLSIEGVLDYENLTINLKNENIRLLEEEIPVLETVNLEV